MKKFFGSIALVAAGAVLKTVADKYGVTEIVTKKAAELKTKAVDYLHSLTADAEAEAPAEEE